MRASPLAARPTPGADARADLGPGYRESRPPFPRDLTRRHGRSRGGVAAALADVAGGHAAFAVPDPDATDVTVELEPTLPAPARGARPVALGTVVEAARKRGDVSPAALTSNPLMGDDAPLLPASHDDPAAAGAAPRSRRRSVSACAPGWAWRRSSSTARSPRRVPRTRKVREPSSSTTAPPSPGARATA